MSKSTKIVLCIVILFALLIVGSIAKAVYDIKTKGYTDSGSWEDTPEKALAAASDMAVFRDSLTAQDLLDIIYFEDGARIFYVSQADTLVTAWCKKNDKGKYQVLGYTEEEVLEEPANFVLNGDDDQWVLYDYWQKEHTVYGWKYTSAPTVLVNGYATQTRTYVFTCQGKEWSIDYWWVDIPEVGDDITLTYASE